MNTLGLMSLVVLSVLPIPALAAPQALLDSACDADESVVIGVARRLPLSASPVVFQLDIEQTLKGALTPGGSVVVNWPGSATAARVMPDAYRALWFLRRSGGGMWEVDPLGGPNAPLFASALAVPPRSGSFAVSGETTCYAAVWAALKDSLTHVDDSPEFLTAAETIFREAGPLAAAIPDAAGTLSDLTQARSANLMSLALAAGIRAGDLSALAQAETQITAIAKSAVAHEVGFAIAAWRNDSPASVSILGRIAQVKEAKALSGDAAAALMMIHTKEAAPYLAAFLSADDLETQDKAIRGLSLFVKGAPVLTPERLRQMAYFTEGSDKRYSDAAIAPYIAVSGVPKDQENEYVTAWKDWWARMSKRFGTPVE